MTDTQIDTRIQVTQEQVFEALRAHFERELREVQSVHDGLGEPGKVSITKVHMAGRILELSNAIDYLTAVEAKFRVTLTK